MHLHVYQNYSDMEHTGQVKIQEQQLQKQAM